MRLRGVDLPSRKQVRCWRCSPYGNTSASSKFADEAREAIGVKRGELLSEMIHNEDGEEE